MDKKKKNEREEKERERDSESEEEAGVVGELKACDERLSGLALSSGRDHEWHHTKVISYLEDSGALRSI